jgi:UDP-glucose 4-epimerase
LGFIGSNVALELLRSGARVTVIDSCEPECGANDFNLAAGGEALTSGLLRCVKGSIGGTGIREAVKDAAVVFNLAGEISHIHSIQYPERDLNLNVRAQLQFLRACQKAAPRARIVYASSRQLYGVPEYLPVDENHPIRPVDFNGVHQWAAENYHFLFSNLFGMDVICLRLTNVYGPRQSLRQACQGFIGTFFRLGLHGETIPVFGDGRQLRDMLYVEDAVRAFLMAGVAPLPVNRVYNVGGGAPLSLRAIAETIAAAAGNSRVECVPFPEGRQAIDIGSYYSDITRFRQECGWEPQVSFAGGVAQTVAFYRRFAEHYLNGPVHPPCQLKALPRRLPAAVGTPSR